MNKKQPKGINPTNRIFRSGNLSRVITSLGIYRLEIEELISVMRKRGCHDYADEGQWLLDGLLEAAEGTEPQLAAWYGFEMGQWTWNAEDALKYERLHRNTKGNWREYIPRVLAENVETGIDIKEILLRDEVKERTFYENKAKLGL